MPFRGQGNDGRGGGGRSGQSQGGPPKGKQPASTWRSRPPKSWQDQQEAPDDVPDHPEEGNPR